METPLMSHSLTNRTDPRRLQVDPNCRILADDEHRLCKGAEDFDVPLKISGGLATALKISRG
jgi:hypothetical protein